MSDAPEILTLTLKRPIKLGEMEPVTEITLEEPTTGQIETSLKEASGIGSNIALVAMIAKISHAHVRAMVTSDFNKAVDFLAGFTKAQE